MEDLKTWYRQNLLARIAELEDAQRAVEDGDARGHLILRRTAHALRGSGGTYGFPLISEAAAAVEDASAADLGPALAVLLKVLRETAQPAWVERGVLIVEDNADIHRLLAARFRMAGRKVFVAETGAQAEAILAAEAVGVVVLDLILPDADGRVMLVRLRSDAATAGLPVLVMTTCASKHIRAECLGLGAAGFFEKPLDVDQLVAAVESALGAPAAKPVVPVAPPPAVLDAGPARAPLPAADTATQPPISPPGAPGPQLVLVVEDDPLVASLLDHRLRREGFEVLHFTDGKAALAGIDGRPLCLAILDVKLPGVDGFQVLSQLRQQASRAQTPIVMLTAMGKEEHVVRGLALGADDYILKPFSPNELIARVRRLLQLPGRTGN